MDSALKKERLEAVRSLLRARTALVERLEAALAADDLPPLSWYDVLCALEETEGNRLRPRDLAYEVALTPSGLTRLLDRIQSASLVERQECPSDRRGHLVALTPPGRSTLEVMRPVYERALEEAFGAVSDEGATTLRALLDPVTASACVAAGEEDRALPRDQAA
jgi:DNA-binding MarR family transcriptional regulator